MDTMNITSVFKNFSVPQVSDKTAAPSQGLSVQSGSVSKPASKLEAQSATQPNGQNAKKTKNKKKHHVLRKIILAAGVLVGASFGVTGLKKVLYKNENPKDIIAKTAKDRIKIQFIKFADLISDKRKLTGEYLLGRGRKLKNIITRNFFGYTQNPPSELTPMSKLKNKFSKGMHNEWEAFKEFGSKFIGHAK